MIVQRRDGLRGLCNGYGDNDKHTDSDDGDRGSRPRGDSADGADLGCCRCDSRTPRRHARQAAVQHGRSAAGVNRRRPGDDGSRAAEAARLAVCHKEGGLSTEGYYRPGEMRGDPNGNNPPNSIYVLKYGNTDHDQRR